MGAPVKHTCPDIDHALKLVHEAHEAASALEELLGYTGMLEKLRNANDALRQWGYEQEEIVGERDDEITRLNERIAELEQQLAEVPSAPVGGGHECEH